MRDQECSGVSLEFDVYQVTEFGYSKYIVDWLDYFDQGYTFSFKRDHPYTILIVNFWKGYAAIAAGTASAPAAIQRLAVLQDDYDYHIVNDIIIAGASTYPTSDGWDGCICAIIRSSGSIVPPRLGKFKIEKN